MISHEDITSGRYDCQIGEIRKQALDHGGERLVAMCDRVLRRHATDDDVDTMSTIVGWHIAAQEKP